MTICLICLCKAGEIPFIDSRSILWVRESVTKMPKPTLVRQHLQVWFLPLNVVKAIKCASFEMRFSERVTQKKTNRN